MTTDTDWQKWGKIAPYFAVLTDAKFGNDRIDENRAAFFESGDTDISRILDRYTRHFSDPIEGAALDFGCGVGRLALPLARRFKSVVGLDISPGMLAEAEQNAENAGLSNVEFRLSDDDLTGAPGQYAFVNTYIVLQHIPVKRGIGIIAKLLDKVGPGGGCHIHIAVQRRFSFMPRAVYFIRHRLPGGRLLVNLATNRSLSTPTMQMNEYHLPDLLRMFAGAGFPEVVAVTDDHGQVQTVSLFGRRQAG